MDYCKTCEKKINVFSKIFSTKKCINCGDIIHENCSIVSLNYDKYQKGIIDYIEPFCKSCAELNSIKFGNYRYCPTCGIDNSILKNKIECELCKKIGHLECFSYFAKKVDAMWIYPHLHTFKYHKYICPECKNLLENKIEEIKSKWKNQWVGGTRSEYLKGFNIIKMIGRVECYDHYLCDDPSEVEQNLKIRAIQLGANAYVKCYWYREYGYHSRWFVGSAEAVLVEKFDKRKRAE